MKIAVLVSGGVDSAVALRLLKEQGHDLTAFYLKIWLEDELTHLGDCPWEQDLTLVREICTQADVPLEVISMQDAYQEKVVRHTIEQVRVGLTPNPDILCNQRIKFGLFYDTISDQFDKVATGHYAHVEHTSAGPVLHCAPDQIKDQTYFLCQLSREQLDRALFPLGHLEKTEVRKLAQKYDLPNKNRKDSQGICFLGKFRFEDFLRFHLGEKRGEIQELESGERLGEHSGFWFHTIGQRKGLGLSGGPWYVVKKDTERNIVYVSRNYFSEDKKRDTFVVDTPKWFAAHHPGKSDLRVKLRHGPSMHDATVMYAADGSISVRLAERDQGIAHGQYAVFYDGNICLGGGVMRPSR